MKMATTIAHTLVRLCGLVQLTLGALFWTGRALALIPLHMLVGLLLVLSLAALALLAARSGVPARFVLLALVWCVVVPLLGLTQSQLLPGSWHWAILVLHLLVGRGAIGQAEALAARIRGRRPFGFSARQPMLFGEP